MATTKLQGECLKSHSSLLAPVSLRGAGHIERLKIDNLQQSAPHLLPPPVRRSVFELLPVVVSKVSQMREWASLPVCRFFQPEARTRNIETQGLMPTSPPT